MSKEIPKFAPRFLEEGGMGLYYEDGRVHAAVDVGDAGGGRSIVIHEWSSNYPGHGHTKEALRWLREQGFNTIVANSVGLIEDGVGDTATYYWSHMRSLGLVDVLLDDEGVDITASIMPAASPKM